MEKATLKLIRKDIDEALVGVGAKYNMSMKLGSIGFDELGFTGKVEAQLNEINGKEPTQYNFEKHCSMYGLKNSDYNKEFMSEGKVFIIKDLKTSARTYPIIAECKETGKRYKFPVEDVIKLMKE